MNEAKHPDHDHAEPWADYYEEWQRAGDPAAAEFGDQLAALCRRIPGADHQWTGTAYTQVAERVEAAQRSVERMISDVRKVAREIYKQAPRHYQRAMNARHRTITEERQ